MSDLPDDCAGGECGLPVLLDRCRLIDLGKWASGGYVISSPIHDPEQLDELEGLRDRGTSGGAGSGKRFRGRGVVGAPKPTSLKADMEHPGHRVRRGTVATFLALGCWRPQGRGRTHRWQLCCCGWAGRIGCTRVAWRWGYGRLRCWRRWRRRWWGFRRRRLWRASRGVERPQDSS